jgi:hypothetical protein
MSEMSQAQGPVGGGMDLNPTDDMVPPSAHSGHDPDTERVGPEDVGSEDAGPRDYGAEDLSPQDKADTNEPPHPAGVPLPRVADSGGEESAPPVESSSDPMPDIAGKGDTDASMR